MVARTFGLTSDATIAKKLAAVEKQNPHISNFDHLRPGDVIYLGAEGGFVQTAPSLFDLRELSRQFQSSSHEERSFILDNWGVLSVLTQTDGPEDSFLRFSRLNPASLVSSLAAPKEIQVNNSAFSILGQYVYSEVKDGAKLGQLASEGTFGNWIYKSAGFWSRVEGDLVRSIKSEARYVVRPDGVLRMIPNNARAFNKVGKVIVVTPEGSGFQAFSKAVAKGRKIGTLLKHGGKLGIAIDFGLGVSRVKEKWETPERNRTAAVEGAKFGAGLAWGAAATSVAGGICGALTFTTGLGGVVCYATVFLVGGGIVSKVWTAPQSSDENCLLVRIS